MVNLFIDFADSVGYQLIKFSQLYQELLLDQLPEHSLAVSMAHTTARHTCYLRVAHEKLFSPGGFFLESSFLMNIAPHMILPSNLSKR